MDCLPAALIPRLLVDQGDIRAAQRLAAVNRHCRQSMATVFWPSFVLRVHVDEYLGARPAGVKRKKTGAGLAIYVNDVAMPYAPRPLLEQLETKGVRQCRFSYRLINAAPPNNVQVCVESSLQWDLITNLPPLISFRSSAHDRSFIKKIVEPVIVLYSERMRDVTLDMRVAGRLSAKVVRYLASVPRLRLTFPDAIINDKTAADIADFVRSLFSVNGGHCASLDIGQFADSCSTLALARQLAEAISTAGASCPHLTTLYLHQDVLGAFARLPARPPLLFIRHLIVETGGRHQSLFRGMLYSNYFWPLFPSLQRLHWVISGGTPVLMADVVNAIGCVLANSVAFAAALAFDVSVIVAPMKAGDYVLVSAVDRYETAMRNGLTDASVHKKPKKLNDHQSDDVILVNDRHIVRICGDDSCPCDHCQRR